MDVHVFFNIISTFERLFILSVISGKTIHCQEENLIL
jgi:hypothetical protein